MRSSALVVSAMMCATACGGAQTASETTHDTTGHDAPRDVAASGERERGCVPSECSGGDACRSPEEASWNFCGAPRAPDCAEGFVGDACGHCFRACSSDADCEAPMFCGGSYCMHARVCAPVRSPPP